MKQTIALLILAFAASSAGQMMTLSHSTDSTTVIPGNSVACATMAPQYTTENSYWRSYTLSAFGVTGDIEVVSVTFGVENAFAGLGAPDQAMEIRLYTDATPPNPAPKASLVLQHTEAFRQVNRMGTVETRNMTTPVPFSAGDTLVVELFSPDGVPGQNIFFIGSNTAGQGDVSYLSAVGCGLAEPTPTATIGFPNMHIILNVNYQVVGPPPPTCTIMAPAGTTMGDVAIAVDAASTSSSIVTITLEYSTDLGVTWNPASMTVGSPNPNPAVSVATGISNFEWDSRGDGVATGGLATIDLRATVIDSVSGLSATCVTTADIDNGQLCSPGPCGDCNTNGSGPEITDALVAAQISAMLVVPTPAQDGCCDVNADTNITILDALQMAQAAAGLPITLMCP